MAIKKVTGFVDNEPVNYAETSPSRYIAEAETEKENAWDVEIDATDNFGNVGKFHSTIYLDGTWIPLVWWRIQSDVNYAKQLNSKVNRLGFSSLTSQEQSDWLGELIGTLSYVTLNRIEIDTKYLADKLYQYGYGLNQNEHYTGWNMQDFPAVSEIERVRENVQTLLDYYITQPTSLPDSLELPTWQKINAIERNLQEIYDMANLMISQMGIFCGMVSCNQGVMLLG